MNSDCQLKCLQDNDTSIFQSESYSSDLQLILTFLNQFSSQSRNRIVMFRTHSPITEISTTIKAKKETLIKDLIERYFNSTQLDLNFFCDIISVLQKSSTFQLVEQKSFSKSFYLLNDKGVRLENDRSIRKLSLGSLQKSKQSNIIS